MKFLSLDAFLIAANASPRVHVPYLGNVIVSIYEFSSLKLWYNVATLAGISLFLSVY
jgi:hypothetical protein